MNQSEKQDYTFLDDLSIQSEHIDALIKIYHDKIWDDHTSLESVTKWVRELYRENKFSILEIFKDTVLNNSDCLTRCIICMIVCDHYWFKVKIARPNSIAHYFHNFLIDKNWKKYKISWESKIWDYTEMTPEEIVKRLQFTQPIITIVNRVKKKLHWLQKAPSD